jgi:hypothetical protein
MSHLFQVVVEEPSSHSQLQFGLFDINADQLPCRGVMWLLCREFFEHVLLP